MSYSTKLFTKKVYSMYTPLKSILKSTSLPTNSIIHHVQFQNDVASFLMLRFTRFNFNHRPIIEQQQPNSIFRSIKPVLVTSSPPMSEVSNAEEKVAQPVVEEKKKAPEPPEKPEAGDCCGSGCVRCVWDVYYEELETYDKLLKEFNDSQKQS